MDTTNRVGYPIDVVHSRWNGAPAFADLDDDGDFDLMIGYNSGISLAYENTGSASSPTWTRQTAWAAPDVGDRAAPALADLDDDGDFDLMIGEYRGNSLAYENTAPVTPDPIPEFSTITLPVATILGLLLFFNHRRRREDA
jgi:hypothetical protein